MSDIEIATRLSRASMASPDDDGMILVPPDLLTRATDLLAELIDAMLMVLPDDIEAYRMLRRAGRSNAEKAAVLAEHFRPVAERLADIRDNLPSDPVY